MKKLLILGSAALAMIATACATFEEEKTTEPVEVKTITVTSTKTELDVDKIMADDLAYMKENYKSDYRWYQFSMHLKDYLDAEGFDGSVDDITNVFMIISDKGNAFDTNIIMFRHTLTEDSVSIIPSLWIEQDVNIKEGLVDLKWKDAFKKAFTSKPVLHTKRVVLRDHLGPRDINPQWTVGNNHGLIFIDAAYGTLAHEQPAFMGTPFETWYGEWPY